MELKSKYQYTYFVYPYIVEETKYDKYINKLLKDKKCTLKIFEKEKDLDIYNHFTAKVRNYMFPTFEIRDENLRKLKEMKIEKKTKFLAEKDCTCFEYSIGNDVQGKIGNEGGIFFSIEKIEIICFRTGICFFTIKALLENDGKFEDLLNFNYNFKDINSEFYSLKNFEKIKIQTNTFKDITELSEIIENITGSRTNNEDGLSSRFYTYSYVCLEGSQWNDNIGFEKIEHEFYKYSNVLENSFSSNFIQENFEKRLNIFSMMKYVKVGITKQSSNLMCSGIDTYNYTKLAYMYENQYFYTYILGLYQKIFLTKLNNEFKHYDKLIKVKEQFLHFTKNIWQKEITLDGNGSTYYRLLKNTLELEDLYDEIRNKYEIVYKDLNIEKNNNYYSILIMLLILSLTMNTVNIIVIMILNG